MCVSVCELWTSYYHCNVGQGSPAIAWGIEMSEKEKKKRVKWKKKISVTIAVLSSDRERNNKNSFALDRKGVRRLIFFFFFLHCFICVTWTLEWMNWPSQWPSAPRNDRSGVLSFCDSGTVTLTDCPLGDEPSSSCHRTAPGQREPVTWGYASSHGLA